MALSNRVKPRRIGDRESAYDRRDRGGGGRWLVVIGSRGCVVVCRLDNDGCCGGGGFFRRKAEDGTLGYYSRFSQPVGRRILMAPPIPVERSWLEVASWASQVLLALIALVAAIAAFLQLRAYKLLEILKLIEGLEIRRARRTVVRVLPELAGTEWWNDEKRGAQLETDASDVCASYDILGLMIQRDLLDRVSGGYGSFFKTYWAASITECHKELGEYLNYRRARNPNAYEGFEWLAKEVAPYANALARS